MNRPKLLSIVQLMGTLLVLGCEPPVGSVKGKVTIEGEGADGITVALHSGETVTTAGGGAYRFDDIEAGTYTITISGYPNDASFASASASATLRDDGQLVTVDFSGKWVRTAALIGSVTVEGNPLGDVLVKITGMSESETLTGAGGQYSFTGLRKGDYTVQISDFDDEDIGFSSTVEPVELDVGGSVVKNFEGTYVRASSILVEVKIEGNGIEDVEVSVQGKGETHGDDTRGNGSVLFEDLRKGEYVIVITNPDPDEYEFEETSQRVEVAYDDMENVQFSGVELRTASIEGVITVDGHGPLGGVTVSVNGKGEDPDPVVTLGNGRFSFDRLYAGEYTVDISGYNDDEYGFEVTSQTVTVARKQTGTADFGGILLRTAVIEGEVTVDGKGLAGVTVTVSGGPKSETFVRETDSRGMFEVDHLHAGEYTVDIFGYDDDEYGFEVTSRTVTVARKQTGTADFGGILLRTGAIAGEVTVKGDALAGVTVTVSGGLKSETKETETDSRGMSEVDRLHQGDYSVTISGYDEKEYGFEVTTKNVTVELRSTAPVAFDGILLRTAGVSGRVTIAGKPMKDVKVTLTGEENRDPETTNDNGQYAFSGLAAGDYTITLSGYDAAEYEFDPSSVDFSLELDEAEIKNFNGRSLRTAVIEGKVTVDGNGLGDVTVTVSGGSKSEEHSTTTNAAGMYKIDRLHAGDYSVAISGYDTEEYEFKVTTKNVTVELRSTVAVSFKGTQSQ